jgi:hypothetical protein
MSHLPTDVIAPAVPTSSTEVAVARVAESARYALLCRMHPSLHHEIAGVLQPLAMTAMLIEKRLQQPAPDMAAIAKNVSAIAASSKHATLAAKNAMGWLSHTDNVQVAAHEGVDELLELLATELCMRGFTTANEVPAGGMEIPRILFRTAFAAALIALCDNAPRTGRVLVTWLGADQHSAGTLKISLDGQLAPVDIAQRYRKLDWDDAKALAATNGVAIAHGDDWVSLQLPR